MNPESKTHDCFPQPIDDSTKVWRYMNLAKFISLLDKRELHFSLLSKLVDTHEGSIPAKMSQKVKELAVQIGYADLPKKSAQVNSRIREITYVSCWNLSNSESEALWRIYCGESGVAIQSTYKDLFNSITDNNSMMGRITYIDYESENFAGKANVFEPIMHKRKCFEYEGEVRIVQTDFTKMNPIDGKIVLPTRIGIPWNPEENIKMVVINPYAPEWYLEVVKSVVRQFAPALGGKVEHSRMKISPVF